MRKKLEKNNIKKIKVYAGDKFNFKGVEVALCYDSFIAIKESDLNKLLREGHKLSINNVNSLIPPQVKL